MFAKRFAAIAALACLAVAAEVRAAVPTCTINGVVNDAAGNPVANGVITFNTLFTQVVSSNTINQTLVSTTTDASGNLSPISLAQGVYVQITVNGGVPITAIVPFDTTVTFSGLISNIVANPTLNQIALVGQTSAPTCTSGDATIYYNSSTGRVLLDINCGGYVNLVTASSTDTLTNKSIAASEINSGVLAVAQGGTNLSAAADDNVMVGNGTTWESKAVPDCQDAGGNHLNYIAASNTITCGTSSSGGGGGGSNPQTDATAILFNNADNTKLLRLDLSGLTTATTRVLTVPNRSATMATSSGTLTSGDLAKFDASGNVVDAGIAIASLSGNTTKVATVSGSFTSGNGIKSDASGNAVDSGAPQGANYYIAGSCSQAGSSGIMSFTDCGFGAAGTGRQSSIGKAGTFRNMYCQVTTAPGSTHSWVFTAAKNGSAQTLTCTISNSSTTCSDTTHSFTVTSFDTVNYNITDNGATLTGMGCAVEFDPS